MHKSNSAQPAARSSAFTLIELLAVLAVVSLIAAMLIPALKGAMSKADQVQGLSNMRQVGIAFRSFTNDNDGRLPGRGTTRKWPADLAQYIAPDVNPDAIRGRDLMKFKVYSDPSDANNFIKENQRRGGSNISAVVNPLDNVNNETSFIMNGYNDVGAYKDGTVEIRPNAIRSQTDTILLGTPKWDATSTLHFFMDFDEGPGNNNEVLNLSGHGRGSNYVFLDGSARFITEEEYKKVKPDTNGVRYGDWLWLVDKDRTDIIQPPP